MSFWSRISRLVKHHGVVEDAKIIRVTRDSSPDERDGQAEGFEAEMAIKGDEDERIG